MTFSLASLTLQQTLARPVACEGVGLHGGSTVRVRLRPSHRRSGIVLRRVDLERRLMAEGRPAKVEIVAGLAGVSRVDHATTLSAQTPAGTATVGTIEHLVAALHGAGIDACIVEVDGPEIPILDGSSAPWVELLRAAGRQPLPRARKQLRVLESKTVTAGEASITCYPASSFRVSCSIDFAHPVIGRQQVALDVTPDVFERELAPARTFGFLREVEALRAAGLVRGGSMDNAVVLDEQGVMNGPLRFEDEFVRHKALDFIGDLALLGMPLVGHFVARRAGHALHVAFAKSLLADPLSHVIEPATHPAHAAHANAALAAHAADELAPAFAGGNLGYPASRSLAE